MGKAEVASNTPITQNVVCVNWKILTQKTKHGPQKTKGEASLPNTLPTIPIDIPCKSKHEYLASEKNTDKHKSRNVSTVHS